MPRLAPLAFALLATFAWAAPHDTTVTVPKTVTKDTAGHCAFIRTPMPDIDMNEGETFGPVNLNQYGAAGDVRITSSPVHGDIAPTIVLGGAAVADDTLTTTDKNNATYQIGASAVAVDGDITFTYDNSLAGCPAAVDTVHVTIHDSGTPSGEVAIPEGPTANTYFVDIVAGLDTNNGTKATPGSGGNGPWKNISKVNGFAMPVGADVFFRQGTTYPQALTIDWNGTSGDHVRVGTYYVNGSQPFELRPDNPTAWPTAFTYSNGARAILQGSCTSGQWQTAPCPYNTVGEQYHNVAPYHDTPAQAVPSTMYEGMVSINANYVDVQDLKVFGSAGVGVKVTRINYGVIGRQHVTIQRVFTDVTFAEGIKVELGQYVTARDNVVRHGSVFDNPGSPAANSTSFYFTNAGATNFRNYYLVERNDIGQGYAEGFDIFYTPKSMIIRGNRIGSFNGGRPCIYGDQGDDIVIEYNICYGGTVTGAAQNTNRGLAVFTYETGVPPSPSFQATHTPLTDVIIRGNMVAGTSKLVELTDSVRAPSPGNRQFDNIKVYGNTAMGMSGTPFGIDTVFNVGPGGIEFKNNIIQTTGSNLCQTMQGYSGGTITFSHNLWNALPPAFCRGAGDVTGTAVLAGTGFASKTFANPAVPADFVMQAGSPGEDVGTPLTATLLTAGDYLQSPDITYPCATFDLKGNVVDANCTLHSAATPEMGARER